MSIFDDINLTRSYLQLAEAFAESEESKKAQKPIHDAIKRVIQYAHDCAIKDLAESGIHTLEKIMSDKGGKLQ